MELMYWWLSALLLVVVIVGWVALNVIRKKKHINKQTKLPLANSWRIIRLPEDRSLIKKQQLISIILLCLLIITLVASLILAGRPTRMSIEEPEMRNRDIMLCLDVSGSMTETNEKLTKLYSDMVKDFDGERIGLVLFDSSPAMIFPLTNDYDFASSRLEGISKAFSSTSGEWSSDEEWQTGYYDLFSGVSEGDGSSLIGDGLAGCINRFDQLDSKRSRSIIFGTDNYLSGNPIVTLSEAADYAKEKDIRVYGINPADYSSSYYTSEEAEEYKKAMLTTNGDYYKMEDSTAVPKIVQKITSQEATRFKGSPQITYSDQPQIFIYIITVLMAIIYIISWRVNS